MTTRRVDAAVIIPFRDRGTDPLRRANLNCALQQWHDYGIPWAIISDGRTGEQPFCRHASYNTGAALTSAEVLVYAEADMLIAQEQIRAAIEQATERLGLVVPFDVRHELNAADSAKVRAGLVKPADCKAETIRHKPRRIGAINVISRATLDAVGQWDETFEGNWWDDKAMHRAFDICAGPTRWVDGPAWHLWHLPGYMGSHLTIEDKAATAANRRRYGRYQRARTPEQIRHLTLG